MEWGLFLGMSARTLHFHLLIIVFVFEERLDTHMASTRCLPQKKQKPKTHNSHNTVATMF
jgi:hypothetical protein